LNFFFFFFFFLKKKKKKKKRNFVYKNSFEEVISNLDFYSVAAQLPVVSNEIKKFTRQISLMVASGYNPIQTDFIRGILGDIGYIGKIYLPIIYEIQSINPVGLITTHPVDNEVVDNLLDVNYYKVAMKIYRKANIIIEKGIIYFSYNIN